jgi:hypothetical protein
MGEIIVTLQTPDGGILESTQMEQAFLAIAQGNAPKEATVKTLEYKEMEPFFVKGESDEPCAAANRTSEIS